MEQRMAPARALAAVIISAVLAGGCGTPAPIPTRPPFPNLETIGVLATQEIYADRRVFRLADGRVWGRSNEAFRIPYAQPAGSTLFVAGSDSLGTFVLLIGGQQGLPAECIHAIGYGGREWGDAIEAAGFLWRKSPVYSASALPVGSEYGTTTRFCLDDSARVTSLVVIGPTDDQGG